MRSNTAEGVRNDGFWAVSKYSRPMKGPQTLRGPRSQPRSLGSLRMSLPSTPPCRKSKDYDAINLYDDIAPGSVSFHHLLESDSGEYGAFPILECVVGSFNEMEAVGHESSVRVGARGSAASD